MFPDRSGTSTGHRHRSSLHTATRLWNSNRPTEAGQYDSIALMPSRMCPAPVLSAHENARHTSRKSVATSPNRGRCFSFDSAYWSSVDSVRASELPRPFRARYPEHVKLKNHAGGFPPRRPPLAAHRQQASSSQCPKCAMTIPQAYFFKSF